MAPRDTVREAAVVALIALVWLGALAWARPLLLPDEGRYAGVAWEMLRSGRWLTPTLDGLPYFHKPPLFYWITAAAMGLFGVHEWAARAASLLGAAVAAVAAYGFMRRWADVRSAQLALAALLAQPLFYVGAQFANLDMLVAGCITATVLLLAHALLSAEQGQRARAALPLAYTAAALGVLAKGLIGVALPLLIVLAWVIARRRWQALPALWSWLGIALFALVAAPWFFAMQREFDGFAHYFFVVQHFQRYAATDFNNPQPFWFFPALLAVFTLPWWPWLRALFDGAWLRDTQRGPMRLLLLLWVLVVVVFFSLPRSKLIGYVLPAVPPLAMLAADAFASRSSATPRAQAWWRGGIVLMALAGIGTGVMLALRPTHSTRELALMLRSERAADEPVYMLDVYAFDLPLYARLRDPVRVVGDWSDPRIGQRDNWRKELADAGDFAPAAARSALITPPEFARQVCAGGVSWVVGSAGAVASYPLLREARVFATVRGLRLWRVDARTIRCEGTPSADSPGM